MLLHIFEAMNNDIYLKALKQKQCGLIKKHYLIVLFLK